jgi:hypothetical protein
VLDDAYHLAVIVIDNANSPGYRLKIDQKQTLSFEVAAKMS